jgi:hypothetical protein
MQRVPPTPLIVQLETSKLLNLLQVENGLARPLSAAQNLKFSSCKLVNAGKFKDSGNVI